MARRPTGTPDAFGPMISPKMIAQGVLDTLRQRPVGDDGQEGTAPLIVYFLAEYERLSGMPPQSLGTPSTYRPATDWTAWMSDETPLVLAIVKPTGAPERPNPGDYGWWFEVQVGAIVKAETEDDAYVIANGYGVALAKAILANRSLGPNPYDPTQRLAVQTELTDYPVPDFEVNDTTGRGVMRSVATFRSLVQPVITAWRGPVNYAYDPYAYPLPIPTVTDINVTVTTGLDVDLTADPLD